MSRGRLLPVVLAVVPVLAGCATTVHDTGVAEPTWRSGAMATATVPTGERLTAYVASFGLADSVVERHPELSEARAGWGLSQRIADALWESGRFRFLEEKAEMVERLADLRVRSQAAGAAAEAPSEARWLLYGELVDVQVARDERVAGLAGRAEVTTRAVVQVRLVDREGGRFVPATGTGEAAARAGRGGGEPALDPELVAEATGHAVLAAAAELARRLEGGEGGR